MGAYTPQHHPLEVQTPEDMHTSTTPLWDPQAVGLDGLGDVDVELRGKRLDLLAPVAVRFLGLDWVVLGLDGVVDDLLH